MNINGVINLNKRKGISSFKAVSEVKRAVGASKAGHTGTLDPDASGVLPICLGKSTRIADYLVNSKKEYSVMMYLGIETDTCDLEGVVIAETDVSSLNQNEIENILNSFIGEIDQVPPIYSAIKVKGRKLYEYARKGESVEIKPRKVWIYYLNNIKIENAFYSGRSIIKVSFTVGCSKGTYIRSLCRDIGAKLDSKGVMAELIRRSSGKFIIEEAYTLEEITEYAGSGNIDEILIPADKLLDIPVISLNNDQYDDYINGRKVIITGTERGEYLVKSNEGVTIGIGSVDDMGKLISRKRL